mmetsp:Transcript_26198/g.61552  ORF Transcript_26198/g.61552 Transcript_26198/m.61552 type:complete len:219 (+) Transcript_26198:420-1076(+)
MSLLLASVALASVFAEMVSGDGVDGDGKSFCSGFGMLVAGDAGELDFVPAITSLEKSVPSKRGGGSISALVPVPFATDAVGVSISSLISKLVGSDLCCCCSDSDIVFDSSSIGLLWSEPEDEFSVVFASSGSLPRCELCFVSTDDACLIIDSTQIVEPSEDIDGVSFGSTAAEGVDVESQEAKGPSVGFPVASSNPFASKGDVAPNGSLGPSVLSSLG